jgi:hypothetical protein
MPKRPWKWIVALGEGDPNRPLEGAGFQHIIDADNNAPPPPNPHVPPQTTQSVSSTAVDRYSSNIMSDDDFNEQDLKTLFPDGDARILKLWDGTVIKHIVGVLPVWTKKGLASLTLSTQFASICVKLSDSGNVIFQKVLEDGSIHKVGPGIHPERWVIYLPQHGIYIQYCRLL